MRMVESPQADGSPTPPIVLVVNDDALTLEMYERMLVAEPADELWVTGGSQAEAIEYARDLRPDIIVSDVDVRASAPGREFLRQLRSDAVLEHVPVLLVAGSQPDGPILQLVDRVVLKPVDRETLVGNVRAVLRYSRHLRERSSTLRQSVGAVVARAQRALARAERTNALFGSLGNAAQRRNSPVWKRES